MSHTEKPLVSVLTPSFNNAEFLERCIRSILDQTYPHVEHVVQDGASTDGTLEILRRYTGSIRWASEPDAGQSDGLNRALQRSRGDIIGVLNADDEYMPHAAQWAVDNLTRFPDVAVVYGDQYNIDPDGEILHHTRGRAYDFEKVLCVEHVIPAQAAFIRRTHLERVGFYADVSRRTCPDYEMWVRLGRQFPMRYVPDTVARYRWHPGSEGRQTAIVRQMVQSKREVMERVFNDPDTPVSLRRLEKRAHSGAVWWGACVLLSNRAPAQGLVELTRALRIDPSLEQVPRLRHFFWRMHHFVDHPVPWWFAGRTLTAGTVAIEKALSVLGIKRKENYAH